METYLFVSAILFNLILAGFLIWFGVWPLISYLACSFSVHRFYLKGSGKKFGWWTIKSIFANWFEYGGGGITLTFPFGMWYGYGKYNFHSYDEEVENENEDQ